MSYAYQRVLNWKPSSETDQTNTIPASQALDIFKSWHSNPVKLSFSAGESFTGVLISVEPDNVTFANSEGDFPIPVEGTIFKMIPCTGAIIPMRKNWSDAIEVTRSRDHIALLQMLFPAAETEIQNRGYDGNRDEISCAEDSDLNGLIN
jgi:hypothetical protein